MKRISIFSGRIVKQLLLAGVLEFGPVLVFLMAFKFLHVYKATVILMVVTIISTVITYRVQKRLPYVALYVALLTSVFGYITVSLHQPKFIQIRDTLYDATSALTLIIGLMVNVLFLKIAFHNVIPMTDRAWKNLTYFWIGFFLIIAVSNEYVRRVMTLQEWFDFKSIAVLITVISGFSSLYFLYEKKEDEVL
jgi:intracellular septation protein